jgi:hypothetical protein
LNARSVAATMALSSETSPATINASDAYSLRLKLSTHALRGVSTQREAAAYETGGATHARCGSVLHVGFEVCVHVRDGKQAQRPASRPRLVPERSGPFRADRAVLGGHCNGHARAPCAHGRLRRGAVRGARRGAGSG